MRQVFAGTDAAYRFAKAHGLRTAWGTDIVFAPELTKHQGAMLTTLTRWYKPVEILKMATSVNGELLAMSGPRNPYPGRLGVIEDNALADLILVDGDPIAEHRADRRPGEELRPDHEGRAGGEERAAGARVVTPTLRFDRRKPGAFGSGNSLSREKCREIRLIIGRIRERRDPSLKGSPRFATVSIKIPYAIEAGKFFRGAGK